MPGGFAHIALVGRLLDEAQLGKLDSLGHDRAALKEHMAFCELGAVGPDYPYLGLQGSWADSMHYQKTGEVVREGIRTLGTWPAGSDRDKALAWLAGYIAHVGTDTVIHPVIELKVGEYASHKAHHRQCEMHQDSYIWQTKNLGSLNDAAYLRESIKMCSTIDGGVDAAVVRLWEDVLRTVYPDQFTSDQPKINHWHIGYTDIVDGALSAAGTSRLFAISRHMLSERGAAYPTVAEIDQSFIAELETPAGRMHYDAVFQHAVDWVGQLWSNLGSAMHAADDQVAEAVLTAMIKNVNLDEGIEEGDDSYVAWQPHRRDRGKLPK